MLAPLALAKDKSVLRTNRHDQAKAQDQARHKGWNDAEKKFREGCHAASLPAFMSEDKLSILTQIKTN